MTLTLILPFQRLYNFLHIYLIYILVLALEEPFFVMSICISKERIPSAPTTDNYFYSTPTISPFPDRYFFRLFELCLMFLVVAKWHLVFTFAYSVCSNYPPNEIFKSNFGTDYSKVNLNEWKKSEHFFSAQFKWTFWWKIAAKSFIRLIYVQQSENEILTPKKQLKKHQQGSSMPSFSNVDHLFYDVIVHSFAWPN